ncbi:DNA cytosine methyltransferase [Acinetobacter sp. YH01009]|uniref:DNA cytosine methyltransferase n=1 Tax=Acinetobacter TaxID=469 RepID=UPI0015D1315B|nr:DNA cytosine methyltransferase [Acinetobacter sp. YH01009]
MFNLLPHELIVDNFAGGGGTSTGLERAFGRPIDIAINHDPKALAMHRVNHPLTKHYCESVWDVDPVEITGNQPVGLVWLSPDCKHHSKAKGGKPLNKNIRGLAWIALRWAAKVRPRVIMLENVTEFAEWGDLDKDGRPCPKRKGRTFNCFVNALKYQGYSVEYKELKACDFGAPTIRNRFFLIARRDGLPIVWPKETHGNPNTSLVKKGRLLPWRTAAECVDLSFDCPSIFKRKKALAPATLERIVRGILKYIVHNPEPYIVDAAAPILTECANGSSRRSMPIDEPLRTITAETKGGTHSLYVCHLSKMKNGCTGQELNEPMHTLTTVNQFAEVRALLTRFTEGLNFKNELFEKFGIIEINGERYCIEDIGFRMLQPFELYKAQGFPHDYIFSYGRDENNQQLKLTKQDQYRMVGNSVPPDLSHALVKANFTHEQEYSLAS